MKPMRYLIALTILLGLFSGCASDGDSVAEPVDHEHLHHEHLHEHGTHTHTHTRYYERNDPAPATGVRVNTDLEEENLGL